MTVSKVRLLKPPALKPRPIRRNPSPTGHQPSIHENLFVILTQAFTRDPHHTVHKESELLRYVLTTHPHLRERPDLLRSALRQVLRNNSCFLSVGRAAWTYVPKPMYEEEEEEQTLFHLEEDVEPEEDDEEVEIVDDDGNGDGVDASNAGDNDVEMIVDDDTGGAVKGDLSYRMPSSAWTVLLVNMFQTVQKQKTMREVISWIQENYPIYRTAPPDWEQDVATVLRTSSYFQRMGRGRWGLTITGSGRRQSDTALLNGGGIRGARGVVVDEDLEEDEDENNWSDSSSATEEENWRELGPQLVAAKFRRHSIAGPPYLCRPIPRQSGVSGSLPVLGESFALRTPPLSAYRSTKQAPDTDEEFSSKTSPGLSSSPHSPPHSPLPYQAGPWLPEAHPPSYGKNEKEAIAALAMLCCGSLP
ncbi:uncharacterized protein VTP21DRAFT_11159 [Calcarisporiella thermophila]|uniref:uncharacterized protein n=1 Tax=Calcarisporiella thermophila TaxID=911321 RepID=UPI0037435800